MANDTDFLSLYQELGVSPDCGLPKLRQAYRRRVSQLHPDRRADAAGAMRDLQRLNALYSAAVDFEQRHGRLPGTVPPPPVRPRLHVGPIPMVRGTRRRSRARRWYLRLLFIGIAGFITFLYVYFGQTAAPDDPASAVDLGLAEPSVPPDRPATLDIGMEASAVLEIEGEPISRSSSLWEYGPSWIGFECEVVVDWYSSPMRPLKVATERPKPHEGEPVSRERCLRALETATASGS